MNGLYPNRSIGSYLRKAREERKLTIECVAERLRLHKNFIADIESDNYPKIPSTYLIGYLRSYAKLLAIPYSQVALTLTDSLQQKRSPQSWEIFCNQKQFSASDALIQWITYSLISILVVLVALWWKSDAILTAHLNAKDQLTYQSSAGGIVGKTLKDSAGL